MKQSDNLYGIEAEEKKKKKISLKLDYNSPVILTFVFLSLAVLILHYVTAGLSTRACFSVYRGFVTPLWFVRLIGHVLGHASWSHYIGNMTLLLLVGPMLEEKYGSKVILEAILITAVVTGLVNIWIFPFTRLLGASGVVFMMIVMCSVTGSKKGTIPITLILVIILYIGQQVVEGVTSNDNISQLTHIIGGVLGAVFGLLLRKKGDKE